jgi:hypothetical protein
VLSEVSGHSYDIRYDLYFTEERIIAVLIRHPEDVVDYQTSLSFQNLFFGNAAKKRKEQDTINHLADERRQKYQTLTPSQLSASHPGNYEISYDSIASIEIKTGFLETHLKICHADHTRRDRSFGLSKKQVAEAHSLLELVIPSKIKRQ